MIEHKPAGLLDPHHTRTRVHPHPHTHTPLPRTQVGLPVVLPSTFQGGPRFMQQRYQDCMAVVRHYGKPDLFITFTCNPKWQEVRVAFTSCAQCLSQHSHSMLLGGSTLRASLCPPPPGQASFCTPMPPLLPHNR